MAFHQSNFGGFGTSLPCDRDGYVPESTDGPWDFALDHGSEVTHDDAGDLTPYGEWWEEEGFPQWRDSAIQATEAAQEAVTSWRARSYRSDPEL